MPATRSTAEIEIAHDAHVVDPAGERARLEQLNKGIRSMRVGGGSLRLNERLLMVIGGVLVPIGVLVIILGYVGAANTGYVFEQVPYLISGGLLGIGLVFLGAFFYFAHWLTELVKEHRTQSAAIIEALTRLQTEVTNQANGAHVARPRPRHGTGRAARDGGGAHADLVATASGTMAHRPDCVVVAGKTGLRPVSEADGLAPCKLCEPYS